MLGGAMRAVASLSLLWGAGALRVSEEAFTAARGESKHVMIKFFAPWCGHCKAMAGEWRQLEDKYAGSADVLVGEVDCTDEDKGRKLCTENKIKSFPTVLYYPPGKLSSQKYGGARQFEALDAFLAEKLPRDVKQAQPAGQNPNVICETTAGNLVIETHEEWAPLGYKRFLELVNDGFFDDQVVYRVVKGFIAQFGVGSTPEKHKKWADHPIPDDPPIEGLFKKGAVSFAGSGPNSRSTHLFIADEPRGSRLGKAHHERPFAIIKEGADEFFKGLYTGYGDLTSLQLDLVKNGNAAAKKYPRLSRVKTCYVEGSKPPTKDEGIRDQKVEASETPQSADELRAKIEDIKKRKMEAIDKDDLEQAVLLKSQLKVAEEQLKTAVKAAEEKAVKAAEEKLKTAQASSATGDAKPSTPAPSKEQTGEAVKPCTWVKYKNKSALPADDYYSEWLPADEMTKVDNIFSDDGESCKEVCENIHNCAGFVWRRFGHSPRAHKRCFFLSVFGTAAVEREVFDSFRCER